MTIGNNIKRLRIKKGLTQKDLADKIHVTFQAVSRWENNLVEPSIDILNELTKILDCSLDELFGNDIKEKVEDVKNETKQVRPVLALCDRCNKPIYETKEIHRFDEKITTGTNVSIKSRLHCTACYNKKIEEERKAAKRKEEMRRIRIDNRRTHSFIWSGLALIILIIIAITFFVKKETEAGLGAISIGIILSSFIACLILDNNFIADMWMSVASWGYVRMPGIIFSLDFDGIIFLITTKILLSILSFLLATGAAILATILAALMSLFVYPFAITKSFRYIESE